MTGRFDRRVVGVALLLAAVTMYRLYETAVTTGNWPGLYFSAVHVAVVVLGVIYGIGLREHDRDGAPLKD